MHLIPPASVLVPVLATALSAAVATAQFFPTYPWPQQQQQQPQTQQQWNQQQGQGQPLGMSPYDPRSVRAPSLEPLPGANQLDPSGLFPTWVRPEAYQGFPVFPPSLGGYGNNQPGGSLMLPGAGQLPPPALPQAPDWPAWVKQKQPVALPYEPATAVLLRQADRVWFKVPTEDAFIPLYHYDNARGLPVGTEVEVRRTGEFLLLLYGGTRCMSFGSGAVRLDALEEGGAELTLSSFTWMELAVATQSLTCVLPDGSRLQVAAVAEDSFDQPGTGEAHIRLERAIEPGDYSGRATIFNHGSRDVTWKRVTGDVTLKPGHRVTFFLSNAAASLPEELREDGGAAAEAAGTSRVWRPSETGSVTWSGARFDLGLGARLQIDPLLGDPFGSKSPVLPSSTSDR